MKSIMTPQMQVRVMKGSFPVDLFIRRQVYNPMVDVPIATRER